MGGGPTAHIALETAVRLRESVGAELAAVALAGPAAEVSLRTAIAAGCERAIRVGGGITVERDLAGDAAALAGATRRLESDLVLTGGRLGRTGMSLVGPALAETLGAAHVGSVASVVVGTDSLVVARRAEGVLDTIETPLPAVVSIEWGARLRYPTLSDRIRARRAPIEDWDEADRGIERPQAMTRVLRQTLPKPRRRLAGRTGPALDHVSGLLLGGVGGGGSGRRLEGEGDEVAAQVVAACLPEMEDL